MLYVYTVKDFTHIKNMPTHIKNMLYTHQKHAYFLIYSTTKKYFDKFHNPGFL